jgi:hypothetical protein
MRSSQNAQNANFAKKEFYEVRAPARNTSFRSSR